MIGIIETKPIAPIAGTAAETRPTSKVAGQASDKVESKAAWPVRPAGFVPLIRLERDGRWRPAHKQVSLPTRKAAVITCMDHVVLLGRELYDDARLLRLVCEHPEFEFASELIDSGMVLTRALAIESAVSKLTTNLERLLEAPDSTDRVDIDGQLMDVDERGVLTPLSDPELGDSDDSDDWPDAPDWARSPGPSLAGMLARLLGHLQDSRGCPLTDEELDQAIVELNALRPPKETEIESEPEGAGAEGAEPEGAGAEGAGPEPEP